MNKRTVSVACTSFNRPDLLERMLRSFFHYNNYPIDEFIVLDDSGEVGCNDHLKKEFPQVWFQYNDERLGQIEAIDRMYQQLETRYVMHLEEDWEFYAPNFIRDSIDVLESSPMIQQVWLRADRDTNNHPIDFSVDFHVNRKPYNALKTHFRGWHGFSFNPGVRRMGDYYQHGPYSSIATFVPERPWESERRIGEYMMKKGFVSAIFVGNGYVNHIGENRGIRK